MQTVSSSLIRPGPNDRQTFDPAALGELADSIREHGLAQPPTVRPVADGTYEIVCGERRFRAMTQVLGWNEVPVLIRDMDDAEAAAVMLTENVSREDIDPIEEAAAYRRRMERFGTEPEALARSVGVSVARVRDRLALLDLAPEIQQLVRRRQVGLRTAALLTGLDADRQRVALAVYSRERLDHGGMAVLCERLHLAQSEEPLFDSGSFFTAETLDEAKAARRVKRSELETAVAAALEALESAGLAGKARVLRKALGMTTDPDPEGPVAEYLRARLQDGPAPAEEILSVARGRGWSERTLRRVKARLGIRSQRLATGWTWALT